MIKFPARLESMIFAQTNFLQEKKNISNEGGEMKFYFQV